jgi:hypothetical protein
MAMRGSPPLIVEPDKCAMISMLWIYCFWSRYEREPRGRGSSGGVLEV